MEKVEMTVWATPDHKQERGFSLLIVPPDKHWWMGSDDIDLGNIEVMFSAPEDMSEQQLRQRAIETLEKKQKSIIADAQNKVTKLQKRIDSMKLLTYVGEQ